MTDEIKNEAGSMKLNNINEIVYEPWYKYGVMFLYLEMFIAMLITIFALYTALSGI